MDGSPDLALVAPSRRSFLIGAGSLGIGVAFGAIPAIADTAGPAPFQPNVWVAISPDETVTILFAQAEMGQGIMTALPLIIAEELDADWAKVHVAQSPADPKIYGEEDGRLGTFGSTSVNTHFKKFRLIGAQTRRILLLNAAERLKVPMSELTTEPGQVVHAASGRRLGYGAVAAAARVPQPLPVVTEADLKPAASFRYIGKDVARVDIPAKVDGGAVFGIDVRLPNMLYGAVLRPPVQGEKPLAIDDGVAKAVPGVVRIAALPYGVGIIAETVEATRRAKSALRVAWSTTAPARNYSSDQVIEDYRKIAGDRAAPALSVKETGKVADALKQAARTLVADYLSDHVAHTCMEPMNATAQVDPDVIRVWAPTQSPSNVITIVSRASGRPPAQIKVTETFLGGGFGRRFEADFALDAYMLAKEVPGRPVKVILSREDDIGNDQYRPLVAQRVEVGLDKDGKVTAWRNRLVADSYFARTMPAMMTKLKGRDLLIVSGAVPPYAIPNQLIEYARQNRGVAVGALRGIGAGYNKFAVEAMVDEIAAARGIDPVAQRLELLQGQPRAIAVIKAAAEMAEWDRKREGRGLGFAYSDDLAAFMAAVAEISLDRKSGQIRVHNIWTAYDAGIVIQPRNLRAQLEGSLVFGTSVALYEQLNIRSGVVDESNFGEYRVLRMSEAPEIHIKVIDSDKPPSGVGEAGVPIIAPAIANAFAQLSGGRRLRHLPLLPERVKAALSVEASL